MIPPTLFTVLERVEDNFEKGELIRPSSLLLPVSAGASLLIRGILRSPLSVKGLRVKAFGLNHKRVLRIEKHQTNAVTKPTPISVVHLSLMNFPVRRILNKYGLLAVLRILAS